tara:strand:+ start:299 stop:496 length:198 start_codon:yes stop_codon:yes gene_type:complete
MDINTESDVIADLNIGPTTVGMVRFFVSSGNCKIPLDFSPDEADEIATEIQTAAALARKVAKSPE